MVSNAPGRRPNSSLTVQIQPGKAAGGAMLGTRPLLPLSPYRQSGRFSTLNRLHSDYEIRGDSLIMTVKINWDVLKGE